MEFDIASAMVKYIFTCWLRWWHSSIYALVYQGDLFIPIFRLEKSLKNYTLKLELYIIDDYVMKTF